MKLSIYSPTHLGATVTSMCLAVTLSYEYEWVGIHTEGDDIDIYGGFCSAWGANVKVNPTENLPVHVYDHWVKGADHYIPVVGNDYRSLRKVVGDHADYAICVDSLNRALTITDVQHVLGVSRDNLFVIRYSPAIQRACDAGLLTRKVSDEQGLWSTCHTLSEALINNSHTV